MRREVPGIIRAKRLRRDMTPPEKALWAKLRGGRAMGVKFARQVPIGPYIVDFAARREKLVIELDGDSHALQIAYDAARTAYLESLGYRVIRFGNHELGRNIDNIVDHILHELGRL